MGGKNLLSRAVLWFCWCSGTTVFKCTVAQVHAFELFQYYEYRVEEAKNNYACVFQSLPLARDGWRIGKKEEPRPRSVLNVCLFLKWKRRSDWDNGTSHPRGSFVWQISILSHELSTCLNISVVEGNPIKVCCCGWMCWLKEAAVWATKEEYVACSKLQWAMWKSGGRKYSLHERGAILVCENISCLFQWRVWAWLYSM